MQSIRRTRSFFTLFWTLAACVTLFASTAPAQVKDFDSIKLYTLENDSGMTVRVTNYGAIITSIIVPDRNGKLSPGQHRAPSEARAWCPRNPA